MPISPVAGNAAANAQSSKMGTGEIAQEDFFKIMIDQLKNQNPLSPQDNSEFLSQMVQFSTMDKMSSIDQRLALSEAFQLIGKSVLARYRDSDGQLKTIEGEVKSVLLNGDKPMLEVGDTFVTLDNVMLAAAPEPEVTPPVEEPGEGEPVDGEGAGETGGEVEAGEGAEGV